MTRKIDSMLSEAYCYTMLSVEALTSTNIATHRQEGNTQIHDIENHHQQLLNCENKKHRFHVRMLPLQ